VDSNLPDVRIAIGGPEVNPFTAEVLAAAGPGYAKALATRLASAPAARLWVPGSRNRADAFGPDADVRGPGDLPVLVLAGDLAAAVAGLTGDLADAVVDVGDPVDGEVRPVPLADRSVAVLNRGTPGCVVTPDGTLHLSLMRSCSAWPSGIWIDGDCRTAPDGSSFAWQHWSHTFEYALASGPGDWRAAGFSLTAEDYNHDLLTVTTPPSSQHETGDSGRSDAVKPGVQHVETATGSGYLSVEPATVTLGALKPRGNPLAAGRTGALTGGDTVTVRLRETSGRPVTARVRFPGVTAAWLTDLLEESDGAPLRVEDDTVFVDLPAFGTMTVALRAGSRGPGADSAATEPVQPVYTRYWLHGKGPAPAGNLPVAVHLSPVRVALPIPGPNPGPIPGPGPDEAPTLTLTVGCGAEPASGTVELVAPGEVTVTASRDLRYDLAPGGYAAWDLTVRVPPGTAPGRYFVGARIRDDLGHLIEDTAMVAVGERRWPDPALPAEDALELMQADYASGAAEADVAVLTPALRLAPGSDGELQVRVTSGLASELRGEAQLVSPFGSWEMLGPWTQGFSVAPGASTVLRFAVHVPTTTRHAQWWALVKVMYYGRVRYTEAIPVVIGPVN
jgi:hypothetical protein